MSGGAGGSLEVGGIGSLKCYQYIGLTKKVEAIAYSSTKFSVEEQQQSHRELCLDIPGHLPWLVRDTENDPTAFTVEIATSGIETYGYFNAAGGDNTNGGIGGGNDEIAESKDEIDANTGTEKDEDEHSNADHQSEDKIHDDGVFDCWGDSSQEDDVEGMEDLLGDDDDEKIDQVQLDLTRAANMNKEFVKYKFKCPSRDNEKALWIAAFKKVGRLSDESKRKKRLFRGGAAAVANLTTSNAQRNSRIRRTSHTISSSLGEQNVEKVEEKEYRVRPGYAYKHRWMTQTELADEMNALSSVIYDTRLSPAVAPSLELGLLKVEVLQILGLPRLKGKHPNTVVYLVCGSYAFTTDVITSCQNPMWLKGMRRACALPIYHGYATLMAGVFHDDGSKGAASKDTFIGRVEVPISHLRPNSTYDVTLPLRQSTSVYTRRQLGAIRIRFSLVSYNEKQSILSYLPRRRNKIGGITGCTTVATSDPKAFRNIALTVHGAHLKEQFAAETFKGHIRELIFILAVMPNILKQSVKDVSLWKRPIFSAYCFGGWMHCCYSNSVAFVPIYVIGFVLLNLAANYLVMFGGVEEFRPPTWKELLLALHSDKESWIAAAQGNAGGTSSREYDESSSEFPFANYGNYKRYLVSESLNASKQNHNNFDEDENGDDDDEGENDDAPDHEVVYMSKKFPEQDIDVNVKKTKQKDKIADELKEVEYKVQEATSFLFDYHTYYYTDSPNPPFGLKSTNDKGKELDKLLGVGQFSQWNPIVSKVTSQFIPILRILSVILSIYRSLYSIATWRDPILTFWVSITGISSVAVLIVFPWRIALFITGFFLLGPQNWALRIMREKFNCSRRGVGRIARAMRELLKDDDGKGDAWSKQQQKSPKDESKQTQPIIHGHAPASNPLVEHISSAADQSQHIVVPYSPLFFNRFSDWPPDPKHSHVSRGALEFGDSNICPSSSNNVVVARDLQRPYSVYLKQQHKGEGDMALSPRSNETETNSKTEVSRSRTITPPPPPLVRAGPTDDTDNPSHAVEGKKKTRFPSRHLLTSRMAAKLQPALTEKRNRLASRVAAVQPALNMYKKQQMGKMSAIENSATRVDETNNSIASADQGTLGEGIPSVIETVSKQDDLESASVLTSDCKQMISDIKNQNQEDAIMTNPPPPNDDDQQVVGRSCEVKEQTIYEEETQPKPLSKVVEEVIVDDKINDLIQYAVKNNSDDVEQKREKSTSHKLYNNDEVEQQREKSTLSEHPAAEAGSGCGNVADHVASQVVEDNSSDQLEEKEEVRISPTLQQELEQLLALKFELATAKAMNDELSLMLKDMESQRDMYKEKYERAMHRPMNMISSKLSIHTPRRSSGR